jgi:FkbM family methyltransferase
MHDKKKKEKIITDLGQALLLKQRMCKMNRRERFMTAPMRSYYPRLLECWGLHHRLTTQTFWGEEMEVVIPEEISNEIYKYGFFEKEVVLFLLACLREGMTYIDVGAHFGFFTLLGSYLVGDKGQVISFEPTPSTYQQLLRNIEGRSNVRAYNYAILDREGEVTIKDYGLRYCAWNSLSNPRDKGWGLKAKKHIQVQAQQIDKFMDMNHGINLVKIDVESTEMPVLRGMEQTIRNHRPALIIEVGDFETNNTSSSRKIVQLLLEWGYSPYEINGDEIVPHVVKSRYKSGNLLFVDD